MTEIHRSRTLQSVLPLNCLTPSPKCHKAGHLLEHPGDFGFTALTSWASHQNTPKWQLSGPSLHSLILKQYQILFALMASLCSYRPGHGCQFPGPNTHLWELGLLRPFLAFSSLCVNGNNDPMSKHVPSGMHLQCWTQRWAAFADIASEILVSQTPLLREGRLAQTQLAYQELLSPRGAYECFSVAHTLSGFCMPGS